MDLKMPAYAWSGLRRAGDGSTGDLAQNRLRLVFARAVRTADPHGDGSPAATAIPPATALIDELIRVAGKQEPPSRR
jgi:hypothetical protein